MANQASVSLVKNNFVATLSDGRRIERPDLHTIAYALYSAKIPARHVSFEWRAGLRMITAGQQVSLTAEMRRLEREAGRLEIAA